MLCVNWNASVKWHVLSMVPIFHLHLISFNHLQARQKTYLWLAMVVETMPICWLIYGSITISTTAS